MSKLTATGLLWGNYKKELLKAIKNDLKDMARICGVTDEQFEKQMEIINKCIKNE